MLQYVEGDATEPVGDGPHIIAHVCNDIGGWGNGFVLALSKRWFTPEEDYVEWYSDRVDPPFQLGAVRLVAVGRGLWVANMIAQRDVVPDDDGRPPIRYDALATALRTVGIAAQQRKADVHMPRIGAGLAGGDWNKIEPIILDTLVAHGVDVAVYDLPAPVK